MRRPTTKHLVDTVHLQASTVPHQANTAAHHPVSTEAPHQDRASMVRHPHKASMAPLRQANMELLRQASTELLHQVNMVSDHRRAVLADTQVSSSTANRQQVGSTSINSYPWRWQPKFGLSLESEVGSRKCVKEQ